MKLLTQIGVCVVLAAGATGTAASKPWWMRGVESNDNDFLSPDVAFRVSSRVEGDQLHVRWAIADGYYLYQQKMSIEAESPGLVVTAATFPAGLLKTDPYLGAQQVFFQQVEGTADYRRSDAGSHPLQIKVTYQGCAEAGLCYPPMSKVLSPQSVAVAPNALTPRHSWEAWAIIGGALAFFLSGLVLRKGRRLESPL